MAAFTGRNLGYGGQKSVNRGGGNAVAAHFGLNGLGTFGIHMLKKTPAPPGRGDGGFMVEQRTGRLKFYVLAERGWGTAKDAKKVKVGAFYHRERRARGKGEGWRL